MGLERVHFYNHEISTPEAFNELLGEEIDRQTIDPYVFELAGFNPDSEEIHVSQLKLDWFGHQQGALVIYLKAKPGWPFTIVEEAGPQ